MNETDLNTACKQIAYAITAFGFVGYSMMQLWKAFRQILEDVGQRRRFR